MKKYITKMDMAFGRYLINKLVVTDEADPSEMYVLEDCDTVAYIPLHSFDWILPKFAPQGIKLVLSVPDYLEIDVEHLNNTARKYIDRIVVRTQESDFEYSIDDFCDYFSQKLVYGQDRTPNRQYRLRPITKIIFDSPQQPLAVGRRVRVFIRPDDYEMPPFHSGDIISRELGDQIREEAYRQDTEDNTTEIIVGQEIIQIAGDIIS